MNEQWPGTPVASEESWPGTPVQTKKKPAATGMFGQIGQTVGDLFTDGPLDHEPNRLERGLVKVHDSMHGTYMNTVSSGLLSQPTKRAMMKMNIGRQPGESDASLRQRYDAALSGVRQDSRAQIENSKINTPGVRQAQQVMNLGASVGGSPELWAIPGIGGVGGSIGMRVATAAAGNAAIGAASDAAAQGLDMHEGMQKEYDVKRTLESAAASAALGAGGHIILHEAAPFVKELFAKRGIDTTPGNTPFESKVSPMTTEHQALNAADAIQYNQLLKTGSVDDIKGFFEGRNGPKPSWQDVNTWVQHRDGETRTGPVQDELKPDFDYAEQYNKQAENQWKADQHQAVADHIDNTTANWKNKPEFEIVHGPEDIADPAIRKATLKEDKKGDALGFLGTDGKVRIFSGRITDPETANAVLYHEGLGHHGLAELFGQRLDSMLGNMLKRNVNQLSKKTDAWQKANPKAYKGNRLRAAEEVLANASEGGPLKSNWKQATEKMVRDFGRKMGLDLAYSDAEINHVLAMAHDAVINGKKSAAANGFRGATQGENRFMYAGKKATGFDPENPDNFIAPDGHERFEFSDENARLRHSEVPYEHQTAKLEDVLDHPELYEQYPQLKNLDVNGIYSNGKLDGFYAPNTKTIGLDMLGNRNPLGTMLHETQHAIQHIEDHSAGATSARNRSEYNRTFGEIEARDTAARNTFNNDQRKLVSPYKLIGISQEDMIINEPFSTKFAEDSENRFVTKAQLKRSEIARKGFVPPELEDIAEHIESNYSKTTISREETRNRAIDMGITPKQIEKMKAADPGGYAARLARIGAAADYASVKVKNIAAKVDTPDWKPEDHVELAKAIAERNYLVERFKGESSEYGRALNTVKQFAYTNKNLSEVLEALRDDGSGLAALADPTNPESLKFARQLKALMQSNAANPKAVNVMMAGVNKPYWEQYITSFHYNAMLSGLSTHVKAVQDMATGIAHDAIDHAIALPIGKLANVVEALTGQPVKPGVQLPEVQARVFSAIQAVTDHEIWRETAKVARNGDGQTVLPNHQVIPTNPQSVMMGTRNPRLGILSKPTDLISAEDTFFRSVSTAQNLYGLGMRQAELDLAGKPHSFDDVVQLGKHHALNPTPRMLEAAMKEAEKALLLSPNRFTGFIDKAKAYRPGMDPWNRVGAFIANTLVPFARVAANSFMIRTIERSPLQLLSKVTRKQIAAGGAEAHLAMARIGYGTIKLGIMWAAADAAKDYLTGHGPDNPFKRKELQAAGWTPNAVHEDGTYNTGGSLNMSLNPFDMHNTTAQMVAGLRQAYEKGANEGQVGNGLKLALGSILKSIEEASWASDLAPFLTAIDSDDTNAGQRVAQFAGDEVKSFVPNVVSQVSRMTNPNQVDTRTEQPNDISGTIKNSIQSAIPGLNEKLPTRYSVYGNPLPTGQTVESVHTLIPGLSGNKRQETKDPAEMELNRLAKLTKAAIITPVQRSVTIDGEERKLSPHEFQEYQRVAGRAIVETVKAEMNSPEWQTMSDQDKVLEVRDIQKDMKKAAREALFNQ